MFNAIDILDYLAEMQSKGESSHTWLTAQIEVKWVCTKRCDKQTATV